MTHKGSYRRYFVSKRKSFKAHENGCRRRVEQATPTAAEEPHGPAGPDPLRAQQLNSTASELPDRQYREVWIGSNPQNDHDLAACGISTQTGVSHFHSQTAVYRSSDGGDSWRLAFETQGSDESGDPTCEFTADGALFFSTLRLSGSNPPVNRTEIYKSENNGPLELEETLLQLKDRGYLTADRWRDSKRSETLFVHGIALVTSLANQRLRAVTAYRRLAGRKAFDDPQISVLDTPEKAFGMGNGVVLANGSLGIVEAEFWTLGVAPAGTGMKDSQPMPLYWVLVKPDEPLAIQSHQIASFNHCPSFLDWSFPRVAVDTSNGPFRGRVYVTWPAEWFGRCRIFLSTSDNQGESWSDPTTIDGPGEFYVRDQGNSAMPSIVVNNRGVLGISWYDRTGIENQVNRNTRFAASLDGGATFLPGVTASSSPANYNELKSGAVPVFPWDRRYQSQSVRVAEFGVETGVARGGETAGLAADSAGRFHLLWTDNRTGVSQMWTTAVEVDGTARPGAPALSGAWRDVTRDVVVEYSNARYDGSSRTITVQARLSTSTLQLKGVSVTLRVTRAVSPFGDVEVLKSGNGRQGSTGVYEFTFGSDLAEGRYFSNSQEIRCRLREMPIVSRELATAYTVSLLRIESKIYAGTE